MLCKIQVLSNKVTIAIIISSNFLAMDDNVVPTCANLDLTAVNRKLILHGTTGKKSPYKMKQNWIDI